MKSKNPIMMKHARIMSIAIASDPQYLGKIGYGIIIIPPDVSSVFQPTPWGSYRLGN
jgi:hypothetical protein